MINKTIIQKRFRSGLTTYDSNAFVQQKMGTVMVEALLKFLPTKHLSNVFEIGSGTGLLTQKLIENFNIDHITINDLVSECTDVVESKIKESSVTREYLMGDAEEISFPQDQDLIISGSTIQWFQNLPDFIDKASQGLNKEGMLTIGTFGPDNFIELKQCGQKGINYLSIEKLSDIVKDKFDIIDQKEWTKKVEFNHPIDVLKHLKSTGVNSFSNETWTKSTLDFFVNHYQKLFSENSVQLTYHPIILILKKKEEKCQPTS